MTSKQYVVAQTPYGGEWVHYLSGWNGEVPIWDTRRERALKLDEEIARDFVARFNKRYHCTTATALRNYIEEL